MQNATNTFDMPLSGLESREAWLAKVSDLVDEDGYAERLDDRHSAIFVEDGKTLLVTFETHDSIANRWAGIWSRRSAGRICAC